MIAVVILGLIGILAFGGGSISWVLFGLMLWAGMYLLFGGRRRQRRRMRYATWSAMQQPQPQPPVPQAPPPTPALSPRQAARLPADVEQKVDRIRRKAAVLGQHADRFPLGSKDLYVVQHTATDYLPATVDTYLEVPSWSVNSPTPDGRTPLKMLHDQLDMLEAKLDEIAEGLRNQRVDRLLANERFLFERFGRQDEGEELTIPRR